MIKCISSVQLCLQRVWGCELSQTGWTKQGRVQGVCFTVLHKTKQGLGMDCVRGHGFVVARKPQKVLTPRKTFMHWASADTFRPGLSVLDAGLPRKDSAEEREERQEWTAPCYFDISIMGCGDSFGEDCLTPARGPSWSFRQGSRTK